MHIVTTDNANYQNIAETIRTWNGTTETYKPADMWHGVESVYWAGYNAGQEQGGGGGYDEGYEAGKQAEWNSFWDAYQQNGKRENYFCGFCYGGWTDETYNPKYPITCKGIYSGIQAFNNSAITDTKVPIIVEGASVANMFAGNTVLETIRLLSLTGATNLNTAFGACYALKNVTIDGSIDSNFTISATAVLTNESVQSIIDHLADLTGATAQTLTFHATVGAKLTDAQKAQITAKNWTLAY